MRWKSAVFIIPFAFLLAHSSHAVQQGKIVFVSTDGLICSANADGSNLTQLAEPGEICEDPKWSPDGKQIAFIAYQKDKTFLYVMNADGSRRRLLARNAVWGLDWSPDGKQIVFLDKQEGLTLLDVTTTQRKGLGQGHHPAWSPDGRTIACSRGDEKIHLLNLMGRDIGEIDLKDVGIRIYDGGLGDFAWSPDSQRLTFAGMIRGETYLYTIDRQGRDLQQIIRLDLPYLLSPSWTFDGKGILYSHTQERRQNDQIRMVEIATGRSVEILPGLDPDWLDVRALAVNSSDSLPTTWGRIKR